MNQQPVIDSFSGTYRFLSNFWECEILYEGITYPSVEHAYQAQKNDNPEWKQHCSTGGRTPGQIKRDASSRSKTTYWLRPDWEEVKLEIMCDLLFIKFAEPGLFIKLAATGDTPIIEGNTWGDTFWGVCNGQGLNMLGKLLMLVRKRMTEKIRTH